MVTRLGQLLNKFESANTNDLQGFVKGLKNILGSSDTSYERVGEFKKNFLENLRVQKDAMYISSSVKKMIVAELNKFTTPDYFVFIDSLGGDNFDINPKWDENTSERLEDIFEKLKLPKGKTIFKGKSGEVNSDGSGGDYELEITKHEVGGKTFILFDFDGSKALLADITPLDLWKLV